MAIIGDTIFAVASGQPPCAIAIMRISGPDSFAAVTGMAGTLPAPRVAALRDIRDPETGDRLDRALVLAFPGPNSATGEDVVELHLHGGRAVITAVAAALGRVSGLRAAEPGEFTRRALTAGRIDLAEAEGLGDLLMATTEGQRRAAMASVEGVVSKAVGTWSARLLEISAEVEAALDFSDEDDVAASIGGKALTSIKDAVGALAEDLALVLSAPPVDRLHQGIKVVLAGPPNSGKSTLLNVLVQRDAAIVSPIAGTTRDRIEAAIVRDGIAYVLTDTAGLAEATDDPIEAIGIERARQSMAAADIQIWLGDAPLTEEGASIWLWPRADVAGRVGGPPRSDGRLAVSAHTGEGIDALWIAIARKANDLLPRVDQLALNQRQRDCCLKCLKALRDIESERDLLIVAELLRLARHALDEITGVTHVEAMLDALFGRFCVGK
ncbi:MULTISPECIES: tRNA uridine-5-carboxymethylaminomethyl(34) synthesis GTPase MnmE [unclassified Sphingomonas]|uniref:tRNA uridine-5-carboxymethylaminomethyl(34) synthesis GTPase MnmE n=1 Tax=unclassified Sphingomonas TaxID=196159 RepID=UPI00268720AA